jgi:hypothetical protein
MSPLVPSVGETVKALVEQIVAVLAEIVGLGFTVTVTVNGIPAQEPKVGVTVYATVCVDDVVLVNVPEINEAADPDAVPVIPVAVGADHV